MKRFFKLALIALVFGLGSQSIQAQTLSESADKPDVVAKAELAKLDKALDLSDEQERTLFRVLLAKEVDYRKSVKGKDPENQNVVWSARKIKENFEKGMKEALTDKQYKKWLKMQ